MEKILRNICALLRGYFIKLLALTKKDCHIGAKFRCFKMSSIRLYGSCKCIFGDNVKIDTNVTVAVQTDGVLKIGDNVGVGPNSMIVCHNELSIGNGTMFGPGVYIYDHDHKFSNCDGGKAKEYTYGRVEIGDNCWFGAGCIVLKGTTVGDNCVIGAGTIVKGNIPSGSIVIQKRQTTVIKQN